MTDSDRKEALITTKRRARIEKEFEAMGRGIWSYSDIATEIGVSEKTVRRDMNHPYASEYIENLQQRRGSLADQLIKRQIDQIEAGVVKPHLQLLYRGKMIDGLLPKKVLQRIGGKIETKVEVEIPELEGLDEEAIRTIVEIVIDDEVRKLRIQERETLRSPEERPEEEMDSTPSEL